MRRIVGKQAPQQTVKSVFEELNRPGIERLKQALRARGITFTNQEVVDVVRGSEQKQVLAPRQRYEGKIASQYVNQRWAADLIDFTAQPSGEFTHILVVQDIFSRKVFAKPLTSSSPAEVTAAFRQILADAGTPKKLGTGMGLHLLRARCQVCLIANLLCTA